jgi:hypothetical protein
VVDVPEAPTEDPVLSRQEELPWIAKFEDLEIMENVGKGAIGDYYHATWRGKEV